ncbi:MAG: hypothetical protein JRI70_10635 [Deltaproteobacteria bacterium]|nr:hypothetical protein [Deltaproteobacteria bacterium]MBW2171340.1 hypothetical protein [Deltaproteobacteria bacterium]
MIDDLIRKSSKALKALVTRKMLIEADSIPYAFNDVPLKKILNWICVEAAIHTKSKSLGVDVLSIKTLNPYSNDTYFHWRLGRMGRRIRFVPSILVHHHSIHSFPILIKDEYHHGQNVARVRVLAKKFSRLRRSIYAGYCFLIPVKLFLQIFLRNLRNSVDAAAFFKSMPLLILCLISWSAGECVGYVGSKENQKSF